MVLYLKVSELLSESLVFFYTMQLFQLRQINNYNPDQSLDLFLCICITFYPIRTSIDCKAETDTEGSLHNRFALFGDFLCELQKAFSGPDKFVSWITTASSTQNISTEETLNFTADTFGREITANFENDADATLLPVEYRFTWYVIIQCDNVTGGSCNNLYPCTF